MATMLMELTCELDGGESYVVVADQRDFAKFEVQPFGYPLGRMIDESNITVGLLRYLAWSASFRTQKTTLKWEAFDAVLIEAMPLDDEQESAVASDAEDPGRAALSATPTSS